MALPTVPAWWLVDYFTARDIFQGSNASLKSKIRRLCSQGKVKFTAYEQPSFRNNPTLKQYFCDVQGCRCDLDGDIAVTAGALPEAVGGKNLHPTDKTTKIIVACGIVHGCGIISSKHGLYLTPLELGLHEGLTCLNLNSFIALL